MDELNVSYMSLKLFTYENLGFQREKHNTVATGFLFLFCFVVAVLFLKYFPSRGEKSCECFNEKSEVCGFPNYHKIKTFKYVQRDIP